MTTARDIMHTPVTCIRADQTLASAARHMAESGVGALPICGLDDRLQGMVTDRDICMAAYTQGKPLAQIPVASAMASHVITCRAKDSLDTAEKRMRMQQIRRIAVVDGAGHPVGVLSLNDLARDAITRKMTGVEHDLVTTLAAVCEPRAMVARKAAPAGPQATELHATA